jgi:hypothetical protein
MDQCDKQIIADASVLDDISSIECIYACLEMSIASMEFKVTTQGAPEPALFRLILNRHRARQAGAAC